ncbi:hypothetical protein JCM15831A_10790 [Asaia astilbis]
MKNPANPGDFGINRTRGVVLSGMSETTKRALNADLIDLSVPWAKRIDRTHLASRPVEEHALRASRFGAEGGVGCETTNSASEIGRHCTGRKLALVKWSIIAMQVLSVAFLVTDLGLALGLLTWGVSFLAGMMIARLWILPVAEARRAARLRASVGGAER